MAGNASFNDIISTTLQNYMPNLAGNIFESRVLLKWLLKKGNMRQLAGGRTIVVPIEYVKNSNAKFYSGAELLDTNIKEIATAAEYNIRQAAVTVGFTGLDKFQNSGEYQIINLVEGRIKNAENSLADIINTAAFAAQAGSSIEGLGNFVTAAGNDSIGGIDASAAGNDWWQNQTQNIGGFAEAGLSGLRTLYNNCARDGAEPDFNITTQTVYQYFEAEMEPRERYLQAGMTVSGPDGNQLANFGFPALAFKTRPVFYDRACTAGSWYMLNSNHIYFMVASSVNFKMSSFVEPHNQDAQLAKIIFYGNLVCSSRRTQGIAHSITA